MNRPTHERRLERTSPRSRHAIGPVAWLLIGCGDRARVERLQGL